MRDDEREQRCDRSVAWRIEIELPEHMVENFRRWWDTDGWWSFRAWHERNFNPDSEWERFMRHLLSNAPETKRPAICDPLKPPAD